MNQSTINRFWSKVKKTGTCWVWTASKRCKGYGAFVYPSSNGDIIQGRAHRFSWELHKGPIPVGFCVLHKCDNPACVNPGHLFLGTKKYNNRDMCQKKRHRCGTSKTTKEMCKYKRGMEHHAFKIPDNDIIKIRELRSEGMSFGKISGMFNISISYTFRICNGTARRI